MSTGTMWSTPCTIAVVVEHAASWRQQTPIAMTHLGSDIWSYDLPQHRCSFLADPAAHDLRSACRGVRTRVPSPTGRSRAGVARRHQSRSHSSEAERRRPDRTLRAQPGDLLDRAQQETTREFFL